HGTLWVGTGFPFTGDAKWKEGGLNRYNSTTKNFTRFLHDPKDPSSLNDNRIGTIFEDSKGTFWIGTAGDGLHTMNREKGTFVRHEQNAAHPDGLSRPPLRNTISWADDFITFIREDISGTFWIGTFSGGLNKYDPEMRTMDHYSSLTENAIDKNQTLGLSWSYTSKDGVLWVAGTGGVFRMDPLHKPIPHHDTGHPVSSIFQERTGELWLGTNRGILVYDSARINKKWFVHSEADPASLSANRVLSILEDREGIIWIGTEIGLNSFDQQTQKFTRYYQNNNVTLSNPFIPFNSIYEDRTGSLWLGTYPSLSSMNREDATFTYYGQNQFDTIQNSLTTILENREGYLWIGTWSGLKRLEKKTNTIGHYLPGFSIRSVFEDTDGVLWIGTNRGLYYFNASNNDFVPFINPGAGLREDINVFHILEDDQQSLWINTSIGIVRLRQNRRELSLYGKNRMIPSVEGTQNNCFEGIGGELFFGDNSNNGYYAFFPEQLKTNTTAPDLHITAFRLGDQLVIPEKGSSLNEHLSQAEEIRLSYNENVFSFEFVGMHYSSPEDNQHLFMLENFDTWQRAGEEKTANYYNVPPGNYRFRVKAANSDGLWTEKSIAIIISPPWWKTVWAYFMFGVLFIAGVLAAHRVQKERVIKAERERTREKELAQAKEIEKAYNELKTTQAQLVQREKMASLGELTAGIAHEIQNPLNFVNNFSDVNSELIEEMKTELKAGNNEDAISIANDIAENEQKIKHHGKRADAIVKGMLQHSRSSSGVKELTDINALADEYLRLAYHGSRAKDRSFNATMKTDFDASVGNINIIPQDIGRVILNVITNAFFAVSAKGSSAGLDSYEPTVSVSTKKTGGTVEIRVKDNGNGIPQKILDKIFQPFFTTKPTGQGTGLGLSLSYDIVKAHGGQLNVETKEGEGSEFIIQLPFN
ncbi:MAG TPA: two-component regulator propeller domain-containing protein, partial [Chryseolinea sp.]|nr:two-component regulator propeller domain-containing protein [Chryseolinea sp.]